MPIIDYLERNAREFGDDVALVELPVKASIKQKSYYSSDYLRNRESQPEIHKSKSGKQISKRYK